MKKLILFLSFVATILFSGAQTTGVTLRVSNNAIEVTKNNVSIWKGANVSFIAKTTPSFDYSLAGVNWQYTLNYKTFDSISISGAAPVLKVSYDSVYSIIRTFVTVPSGYVGGGPLFDYTFNVSSSVTNTTVQQIIPASGQTSIRNYITGITYSTDLLGAAGNAWILDGAVVGSSVSIATPGVFTSTAHDLKVGDALVFTSLGTITGVSVNTVYYVTSTSFTSNTFTAASTQGGTALAITGSSSAFTFYRVLCQLRLQTPAIASPVNIQFLNPLRAQSNAPINLLIPTSLTSGNIYITPNGYRGF